MTNHPNRGRKTYTVQERGAYWVVVESDREVARYRKDEIAYNGCTDMHELRRDIREDLRLKRGDSLVVED